MGVTTPSITPNMLPSPRVTSMLKNSTAQSGEIGIFTMASVKAMNVNPGPWAVWNMSIRECRHRELDAVWGLAFALSTIHFMVDTAEIRFSAVRSPRIWVSGYCTKWRIQGKPRNSILSPDTFRYVRWMHLSQYKFCTSKMGLQMARWNFISTFASMATNAGQRKWRQIRISMVSL